MTLFTSSKIKKAALAALLLIMAAVFCFSSQSGAESTALSDSVSRLLGAELTETGGAITYVVFFGIRVRKLAHFLGYSLMGASAYLCLKDRKTFLPRTLLAVGICFLYACSDELHQYFVPGRECALYDVAVDTCGALLAAGILTAFNLLLRRKVRRHEV